MELIELWKQKKKGVQVNLFKDIKELVLNVVKSRLFVLVLVFIALFSVMVYRLFFLQIVNGESYLENFTLKIKKERTLNSTRGNIYDREGNVLAYNELAYAVTIEDNGTYSTTKIKNQEVNQTIYELIQIIEGNEDKLVNDFNIVINESGNYEFSVEGNSLLRFLADVYGKSNIDDLKEEQKNAEPEDIIDYLSGEKIYGIAETYSMEERLKIITVRYSMAAKNFQKYLATTVATGVSDETVAVIMENLNELQGVGIAEDTIRKYVDSEYFSHIIGYTGKISQDEYKQLVEEEDSYELTDIIGKAGIEQYMETKLQGEKGFEAVYVDNMGRVVDTVERMEPSAGNDVYLSIDMDLQKASYHIIEQKLAGILVSKIKNIKVYTPAENASSSDIIIPIDDVYYALIDNNVININNFTLETATSTEKSVYDKFLLKQKDVLDELNAQLVSKATLAYENLNSETQVYISHIASMLQNNGVLIKNNIDTNDQVYIDWKNETISLREYLIHAISMNWIDISKINVESQYSDSEEIYSALLKYIEETLEKDSSFNKKLYKYMIRDNTLTGREVCLLLYDQEVLEYDEAMVQSIQSGSFSPYNFMVDQITNLKITPAQLALDPCSGSTVIVDVNTGEVLAMVTYPSYDNNKLANSIDADYYNKLLNDLSLPLINRATQQKIAPGSTFKMVSSVAGLEENVISINETIQCLGLYDKINPSPKCWIYPSRHGSLNVVGALQHSCNYFFFDVAYRLSIDETGRFNAEKGLETLKKYAEMFGLGTVSGVEVTESSPEISDQDSVRSAIGQGTHNYTNVQLARYVTTVANGGTNYNLSVLDKLTDSEGNLIEDYTPSVLSTVNIQSSTWNSVHEGMRAVVENTAAFNGMTIAVAGKTGTAQENKTRANHALFVGYAPYENPEIAISIQIANGYTSANAAEIARDIIKYRYNLADTEEVLSGTAMEPDSTIAGD